MKKIQIMSILILAGMLSFGALPVYAQDSAGIQEMKKKMDEILEQQKQILEKLEEVKKEVYIAKIRATR